ncbi:MAG TPA: hypothetical protein VGJ48_10350, partial [Pyrinomonadaceae bacterium]
LSILDSGRTHLFSSSTAEAPINMPLKSLRIASEPAFTDSPHQIKTATRSVVFIAGNNVGGTSLQTEATVYAG